MSGSLLMRRASFTTPGEKHAYRRLKKTEAAHAECEAGRVADSEAWIEQ